MLPYLTFLKPLTVIPNVKKTTMKWSYFITIYRITLGMRENWLIMRKTLLFTLDFRLSFQKLMLSSHRKIYQYLYIYIYMLIYCMYVLELNSCCISQYTLDQMTSDKSTGDWYEMSKKLKRFVQKNQHTQKYFIINLVSLMPEVRIFHWL